jgi:hypothetical protein
MLNLNLAKHEWRTYFLSCPLTGTGLDLFLGRFLASVCLLDGRVCPRRRRPPCRFVDLAVGTCFLTVLPDDAALGGDVFEDGALRPLTGFVVADLLLQSSSSTRA